MFDTDFSLGSRLRGLRKERGFPSASLADLADLSPNAVSLIERDEISPSVATLQRLAAALGVKMSYFFESATVARILHFHPNQRPAIRGAGITIEGLGARLAGQQMEPFFVTLAPHADMGAGHVVIRDTSLCAAWPVICNTRLTAPSTCWSRGTFCCSKRNCPIAGEIRARRRAGWCWCSKRRTVRRSRRGGTSRLSFSDAPGLMFRQTA